MKETPREKHNRIYVKFSKDLCKSGILRELEESRRVNRENGKRLFWAKSLMTALSLTLLYGLIRA